MQTQRIWGFPGPCLCLLFSFLWVSCAVKHGLKPPLTGSQSSQKDNVTYVWEMEVTLVPEYVIDGLFIQGGELAIQPYDVQFNLLDLRNRTKVLVLLYRLRDFGQVQQIRDELVATGMVTGISINKITN
jgi:hypothetical protein